VNNATEFAPQWASPPGDTIADVLSVRSWSHTEFAERLGESLDVVEDLLAGRVAITIGLARRLHEILGASIAFWMARDLQYREDARRLQEMQLEWRDALPLADMTRLGWIPPEAGRGSDIDMLLDYFDVPSVPAWHARYAAVFETVDFRTSPTFRSHPGAVAAWLRQGERVAATLPCAPWNTEAVRETLESLRALTRVRDPERFLPRLRAAVAACGVAVALIPAPTGCRASGATMWLSADKALLLLSARHLTDDHFWFTFYHECGHLLLHRDTQLFLEGEGVTAAAQEDEANAFAADVLVPPEIRAALQKVSLTTEGVLRLASQAGVAPGILVGQLQQMGRLGPERLNRLKRRYEWVGDRLVSRERR
jgi:plasmid maintenance system antidote protein VapI